MVNEQDYVEVTITIEYDELRTKIEDMADAMGISVEELASKAIIDYCSRKEQTIKSIPTLELINELRSRNGFSYSFSSNVHVLMVNDDFIIDKETGSSSNE